MSESASTITQQQAKAVFTAKGRYEVTAFLFSFGLCSILAIGTLIFWLRHDPSADFTMHTPGMCGEPIDVAKRHENSSTVTSIGALFTCFDSGNVKEYGNWPRFRGNDFDNISKENISLKSHWDVKSPPVIWSVDLGEGHAAPAVAHGRVYLLDYDEKSKADMLRCFALSDGRELWRRGYKIEVKRNHGRSRTISAVTDRFCVTIGPRCHVMCVHPFTGEFKWGIDLKKEYGTEVPLWYTGQCPLIDDTVAVIAPAGNALMIGVDCATGTVLWKTPNPDGWKMSHSSVIPGNFHGRKVYLYCAIGGIAGIAADGDNRGNVLFSSNAFNKSVIAPSPVILGDNRIFVTAGYGAGSMLFRVTRKNGEYSMNVEKEYGVKKGFASEQQTPVYYNGYLYGIMPKDAGELRNQLVCVHPNTPDKVEWSSGKERRFGLGPYLVADGKIFVFNEDGELTVVEATHRRFTKFGSVQLMDGIDAWAPLALTEGLLLVRDAKKMLCVNIREKSL